jgi:hypothetical protein
MFQKIHNRLHAIDSEGKTHIVLVESARHVRRTPRGAVIETAGDRFFLASDRQPLVLDRDTARLRTEDGRREFTFDFD